MKRELEANRTEGWQIGRDSIPIVGVSILNIQIQSID